MRRLQLFQKTEPDRCLPDYWKGQREPASRAVASCLEVRDAHGKSLFRSYPVASLCPSLRRLITKIFGAGSHSQREAGYSSESRSSQSRASVGARRTVGWTPKRKQDGCGIHRANPGSRRLPSRKKFARRCRPTVGSWTDVWNQSQFPAVKEGFVVCDLDSDILEPSSSQNTADRG